MATSDEELQQLHDEVVELRQQVYDATAERQAAEQALARDNEADRLRAEKARLQAELGEAKRLAHGVVNSDVQASSMQAVQEQMYAAQEQTAAQAYSASDENA